MYNTLDHNLAEVEAKKTRQQTARWQAKAYFDTLCYRLAEVKLGKVGQILTNLKAASPVLTLLSTLALMKPARGSEHPA